DRFAAALHYIALFFGRFHAAPIANRVFELGSMIADLNQGISNDLLTPSTPDNRRPDSSLLWRARARVVIGLDALIRAGRRQSDAARDIERNFSELKKLVSAKRRSDGLVKVVLWKTIIDWRKRFASGSVKNSQAMIEYEIGKELVENLASQGG